MSPVRYLGAAEVAALFGVDTNTVSVWRRRYGDFPEPDVLVGRYPGWRPEREAEIRAWHASRPGQGAGGGRPVSSKRQSGESGR